MSAIDLATRTTFADRDDPSPAFIAAMRERYPTEREADELLVRKMERRTSGPFRPASLEQLTASLEALLRDTIEGDFRISDQRWFTGGVSKIQMGLTLTWTDPERGPANDRLVIRMEPRESSNATSRLREFEIVRAFAGTLPVPRVFWVDPDARWFPEPALIYAFAPGVSKPSTTATGQVAGLGTNFGPRLREQLGPQFVEQLATIHRFDHEHAELGAFDRPEPGTTQSALWQVNRARRAWEEDRGEDLPLIEVAFNWLTRTLPVVDHVSVIHGDYRSGNFLFDEADGRITAWLDWERSHLGDRHRDLAWATHPVCGHYAEDGRTYLVSGLVPLEEFYERYERASGLPVDRERLRWYRILNCCHMIVTGLATAYRVVRLGKSHQDVILARVAGMVPVLVQELRSELREVL